MNTEKQAMSSQFSNSQTETLADQYFEDDKIKMGSSKLQRDIASLYLNRKFSDVAFIVHGQKIYAHKVILAVRSKYFEAQLLENLKEGSQSEITLTDVSLNAFKKLLKFIYCDQITLPAANLELTLKVLDLANEFLVEDLKMIITEKLVEVIDVNNVCHILQKARLCNLSKLLKTCLSFVDDYALEFLNSDEFKNQPEDVLVQVLRRDSFQVPEIEIFKAVAKWCKTNEKSSSDLVKCVRLSSLSIEDILGIVKPANLVKDSVILEAISEIHGIKPKTSTTRWYHISLNVNVATTERKAHIINSNKETYFSFVLNGNQRDQKFVSFPIDGKEGLIVKLESPAYINNINILLHNEAKKKYYRYYVEMSRDNRIWKKIIDYTRYNCRGLQELYFEKEFTRYIKVVGTYSSIGKTLDIVSFEAHLKEFTPRLVNNVIGPYGNVALLTRGAIVIEGYNDCILNGDSGSNSVSYHHFHLGSIIVQLAQPYIIDTIKLHLPVQPAQPTSMAQLTMAQPDTIDSTFKPLALLRSKKQDSYKYYIESSLNKTEWSMIADKRNDKCSSWQVLNFAPRPIVYIRITGTHSLYSDRFSCCHMECYASDNIK